MTKRKGRRRSRRSRKGKRGKKKDSQGSSSLRSAGNWSLYECLLTKDWRNTRTLTQILVSRRSSGQIAVGSFLVDQGCLGVKSAFGRKVTKREYQQLRNNLTSRQEVIKADIDLVAKIIQEAIAYAGDMGFRPDPDYRDGMLVLGHADPDACEEDIPVGGEDGKPYYFAGPYDDVDQIMDQLMHQFGPDGFHYVVPVQDVEDL